MLEAAAPAAVLSAKAGKARHPQRRTCDEAGQGAVVGDSFRGTPHRERAARVCDGMTGFLRTLVLTIGLLCHGQSGATGLLAELDASSPAATLGSFHAETQAGRSPLRDLQRGPDDRDAVRHGGRLAEDRCAAIRSQRDPARNAPEGRQCHRRLPCRHPAAAAGDPAGIGPGWRRRASAAICHRTGRSRAPKSAWSGWVRVRAPETTSSRPPRWRGFHRSTPRPRACPRCARVRSAIGQRCSSASSGPG